MSVLRVRSIEDLHSPLLGASVKAVCSTCSLNNQGCPGHFGFFSLPIPVFHPFFTALITRVVNCVCIFCARLKVSSVLIAMLHPVCNTSQLLLHRLKLITVLCQRQSSCFFCNKKPVQFRLSSNKLGMDICISERWHTVTPGFVHSLLRRISEFDLYVLGFDASVSHPANCILRALPILPPVGRPSTKTSRFGGSGTDIIECEDDITTMYHNIITACKGNVDITELSAFIERLFVDSGKACSVLHRKHSTPVVSFRRRWVGKSGRMRREIMGKRTNHCARSVVTCDCDLEADEVGVPLSVLCKITHPVVVCEWNKTFVSNKMQQGDVLFVQGSDGITQNIAHLAAFNIVFEPEDCIIRRNQKYKINNCTALIFCDSVPLPVQVDASIFQMCKGDVLLRKGKFLNPLSYVSWPVLKLGDVVSMCPQRGSVVLFNRQPTLVEESMIGMRIRPLPIRSFSCTCAPLEAMRGDYDGDEVNIHFPQSEAVNSELKSLMMLEEQIVTGQSSRPVVKVIHDAIAGFFWILTRQFERTQFMRLACLTGLSCGDLVARIRRNRLEWQLLTVRQARDPRVSYQGLSRRMWEFSGLALLSLIVPESFSFTGQEVGDVLQRYVCRRVGILGLPLVCENGVWLGGIGDAMTLNGKNGIIHQLMLYHDNKAALFFITGIQRITGNMSTVGYSSSIGITDCETEASVFQAAKIKLNDVCHRTVTSDVNIAVALRHVSEVKILKNITVRRRLVNTLVLLTALGSKGSLSNIFQTTFSLGQQVIEGSLVDMNWTGRAMSYVGKFAATHVSNRGFVLGSFLEGLNPLQFFFHAMAGREALVEAATSTANSGYKMRLSVKKMEHSTLQYDHTVRDRDGTIIQFLYGDDGLNQKFVASNQLPWCSTTLLKLASYTPQCDI